MHARVDQKINEAKQWVVTQFGLLEHNLYEQATEFKNSLPPTKELDMTKSTRELNERVVRMVQAINNHR